MTTHATNTHTAKDKWFEIKGDIKKTWSKLSDEDLEKTKGDMKEVGFLLKKKYGDAKENYSKKLTDIFARFDENKDGNVDPSKKAMKN